MKLFLICDNPDTAVGLRLAGIEGVIVNGEKEASDALNDAVKDENIAIVLMNKSLFSMCDETIRNFRKNHSSPLLLEIPNRGEVTSGSSLSKYIRETVGMNI